MLIFQKLVERWKREKLERLEEEHVFDVAVDSEKLTLIKRFEPLKVGAFLALFFAGIWLLGNWFVFKSPVNRGTWIGWVLLWCCFGPLVTLPTIIEAWRAWRGECWIFDNSSGDLKLNGQKKIRLNEIRCIRVWESASENGLTTLLALLPKHGRKILLTSDGYWDELFNLAKQISVFTQIPLESDLIKR